MSDGTSVGKIQMDFEINQKSVDIEIKRVSNYINSNFKNMFSGIAKQSNNFIKDSLSRINSGFKNFAQTGAGSNDKVSKSISKMNDQYKKTEDQIKKIQNELLNMDAQRDAIINNYKDMPAFSGMTKDESLEQMLKSDSGFKELTEKIEELNDELEPLIVKNKLLGDEIKNVGNAASNTGNNLNKMSDDSKRAGNEAKKSFFKFKLFGDEMKNSGTKAASFAAIINKSFMTILKRLFVYNLIMKGIRGIMSHMGAALNTNKQFIRSLNIVKTNLRVAFQPIYDFMLPALNALMQGVARVTTYIANAISSLFGKSYQQSFNAAKGLEASKKVMEEYGKSAKKASGALAAFDEINQLDISDEGGAGEFEMTMPDTSTIDLSGMEKLKSVLQPTIDSLNNLGLALDPLKNFVSTGLQDFYNNFLTPVGNWTLGEGLPRFIDAISIGLLNINWELINAGLNNLWSVLTPFSINMGEGLLWFWENVLTPLGTWTMNNVVPIFLDILAESIKVLNNVIEALKPLGLWLWDNFLDPLAEWTGGIVVQVLEEIKDALKGLGDWVSNNQEKVQTFFTVFATWKATSFVLEMGKATGAIIANTIAITAGKFETIALIGLYAKDAVVRGISTAATWAQVAATTAWNGVAAIATGVTAAFGAAVAFLTSPIGIAVVVIGSLISIGIALYKNWDEVSNFLKKIWEGIRTKATEVFGGVKTFISNTTTAIGTNIDKFSKSFKTTWDKIWNGAKTVFSDMWDSLTGIVKGVINGIIGIVNKFIDFWNKIELKVPSVNIPLIGEVGGFNIGVPKLANIPKLARGGIIDQPTLAMVGERGKEAVIPFENSGFLEALTGSIVNALLQALPLFTGNQESNTSYDNQELVLNIEGTPLVRILLPLINNELSRLGYKTLFQLT